MSDTIGVTYSRNPRLLHLTFAVFFLSCPYRSAPAEVHGAAHVEAHGMLRHHSGLISISACLASSFARARR